MRLIRARGIVVTAATMVVVFGLSGSSWARTVRTRVHASLRSSLKMKVHPAGHAVAHPVVMTGEEVVPGTMPEGLPEATATVQAASEKPYTLRLSNLHTGETLEIVYRIGNTYIPEALEKLNYFLRDHNTQDVSNYDPKEFDVLHAMMSRLGKVNGLINVVCGYRTPETNAELRQNAPWTGVAEHSQHMEGHAIDLRVPGVSTAQIRNAVLSLHAGGVGYYPVSQFVHVDVGPVREWVYGRQARRVVKRGHRIHAAM
jgi:uncharacterized protein YcbK (DUF882 family)